MIDLENKKKHIEFFETYKILSINNIKIHITYRTFDKYTTQKRFVQVNKIKSKQLCDFESNFRKAKILEYL